MALPAAFKTRVDNWVKNTFAGQVATAQTTYLAANRIYFQGIRTPDIPNHGNNTAPDKTRKPHDQPHDWDDFGVTLPATTDFAFAIDVHNDKSYRLRIHVMDGLDEYVALYDQNGDPTARWYKNQEGA